MLIDGAVQSGRYGNASEVVREALRLFEEREGGRLAWTRALARARQDDEPLSDDERRELEEAEAELGRGEVVEHGQVVAETVHQASRLE